MDKDTQAGYNVSQRHHSRKNKIGGEKARKLWWSNQNAAAGLITDKAISV